MLANKMHTQFQSYEEVIALAKEKEEFLSSLPAISPVSDKNLTRFASGYGYRIHPVITSYSIHYTKLYELYFVNNFLSVWQK